VAQVRQLRFALNTLGLATCGRQHGQQKCDQDGNDTDDDQKLDDRESATLVAAGMAAHAVTHPTFSMSPPQGGVTKSADGDVTFLPPVRPVLPAVEETLASLNGTRASDNRAVALALLANVRIRVHTPAGQNPRLSEITC
jgi:hypothetical protein